jgi:hypothetical protein
MLYEILAIDVWGNSRDGYEINAQYRTGVTFECPDDADDATALKLLRRALGHRGDARGYHDPYQDAGQMFFCRNRDGMPAYVAYPVEVLDGKRA